MNALQRNNAMLYGSGSSSNSRTPAKQSTVVQTVPRAATPAPKTVGNYSASFNTAYNRLNPTPAPRYTPTYSPPRATYSPPKATYNPPAPAPAPKQEEPPNQTGPVTSGEDDPMYWYNLMKSYGYKKGGAVTVKTTSRIKTAQKGKKNSCW